MISVFIGESVAPAGMKLSAAFAVVADGGVSEIDAVAGDAAATGGRNRSAIIAAGEAPAGAGGNISQAAAGSAAACALSADTQTL